jgi:hypothetical protein
MSYRFAAIAMCTFFVGAAASMVWGHNGDPTLIHSCVAKDGTIRIVGETATCKSNERALDWNIRGIQGIQGVQGDQGMEGVQGTQGLPGEEGMPGEPGLSGYENPFEKVALDETISGEASDGQGQQWSVGRAHCPAGKKILGGSHTLRRLDGNRLSDAEWATLLQWGTQLVTLPDGTGEYQVVVLNPTSLDLAAETTIVCANVADQSST